MTTPAAAISSAKHLRSFIVAGNAIFTIVSRKTGVRRTFKVRALPKHPKFGPAFGVSFLNGPENTTDYRYLGTLREAGEGLTFKLKDPASAASESARAFEWLVRALNSPTNTLLAQAEVWHAGRCGKCGRLLTDPESISTGLGPKCAGR